jgi:hypothetical protein
MDMIYRITDIKGLSTVASNEVLEQNQVRTYEPARDLQKLNGRSPGVEWALESLTVSSIV